MRVLLLRPVSGNERFGLAPFFRVEPLGLAYVAADLLTRRHEVRLGDLRFRPRWEDHLRHFEPHLVGIGCTHAVDIPSVLDLATRIKRARPATQVVVGGHAASVFPDPFVGSDVDAVCLGDGEYLAGQIVDQLCGTVPPRTTGDIWLRGQPLDTASRVKRSAQPPDAATHPGEPPTTSLDAVPLPARHLAEPFRRHYICVHKQPVWAVETARGCPYRCNFCSTWRRYDQTLRVRGIDAVCRDLANVGPNVFIVDDLFWYPRERSLELARELSRRGLRKDWILVQSRLDIAAHHPELLEAWRPLARQFDVFFGFEAPSDAQLARLDKDFRVDELEEGLRVSRRFDYGITGNFIVDPDWGEDEFRAMWQMVDRLSLHRLGYTVLTPMPGTDLFRRWTERILDRDWSHYDMHHMLFEPRLGRRRFFELFVQSWKRNVLGVDHSWGKWWRWLTELSPSQVITLASALARTQRLFRVDAYLAEAFPLQLPAELGAPRSEAWRPQRTDQRWVEMPPEMRQNHPRP
ncbi:MAG: cobalamin-dependent protein [Polyangiaceae bacterium]|nr:cobalamin-dependent protein [Polyangiaceae bacterium]